MAGGAQDGGLPDRGKKAAVGQSETRGAWLSGPLSIKLHLNLAIDHLWSPLS